MARIRDEKKALRYALITQTAGTRILTHPEEVDELAAWVGVTPDTAKSWSKPSASSGGFTILYIQSWLRGKGLMPTIQLSGQLTAAQTLAYGISQKVIDPTAFADKLGISPPHRLIQYAEEELAPRGMLKLRLEWELSQVTVRGRDGITRPLYKMSHFDDLHPPLASLGRACCRQELTVEVIANQLGVTPHSVNNWLIWKNSNPSKELLDMIQVEFAPYIAHDTPGPTHTTPATKQAVVSRKSEAPSQSNAGIMPTPDEMVINAAEIALIILRGYIDHLEPSNAITTIDSLRAKNPNLFYVLALVTRVMADPEIQYPQWRKARV